jgi:hypothetical protein
MQTRIKLAAQKNCDGVDPDNVDAFSDEVRPGGGFNPPLSRQDTIDFIKKLSAEAHSHGLAMGLKNAESILPQVSRDVEFAVNEQCATSFSGCSSYSSFLASGKPVFHIEYATPPREVNGTQVALRAEDGALGSLPSEKLQKLYCLEEGLGGRKRMSADTRQKFSTVIKEMDLGPWVVYCDSAVASGDGKALGETPKPDKTQPLASPEAWKGVPKDILDLFKPKGGKPQESAASQDQESPQAWRGWGDWWKPKTSKHDKPAQPQDPAPSKLPEGLEAIFAPKASNSPESDGSPRAFPKGWGLFPPKAPKSVESEDSPKAFPKEWAFLAPKGSSPAESQDFQKAGKGWSDFFGPRWVVDDQTE